MLGLQWRGEARFEVSDEFAFGDSNYLHVLDACFAQTPPGPPMRLSLAPGPPEPARAAAAAMSMPGSSRGPDRQPRGAHPGPARAEVPED